MTNSKKINSIFMSRKLRILLVLLFANAVLNAQDLTYIPLNDTNKFDALLKNEIVTIHYNTDDFVIATVDDNFKVSNAAIIAEDAWSDNSSYYILWSENVSEYEKEGGVNGTIIFTNENFVIAKLAKDEDIRYKKNSYLGVCRINDSGIKLPKNNNLEAISQELDENDSIMIAQLIMDVNQDTLVSYVQHLQDYQNRHCNYQSTIAAQEWIKDHYERLGYSVTLQDVWHYPTKNVIATKVGSKYPDEFVVCGAHYDSYSYSGNAPGADDNATGTAGVMEIARILSEIEFERTIVICSFTAEEMGLHGSEVYVSNCSDNDDNIIGYVNIDMSGYLAPGMPLHTTVTYPNSAQELYDFYESTCTMFMPDFHVSRGLMSGGDSDHTSFNRNGYMGIFPFENVDNYCPYIHTSGDTIGTAVNNFELCQKFTQACLSTVARMANIASDYESIEEVNKIEIYPNPVSRNLHIKTQQKTILTIYNSDGKKIDQHISEENSTNKINVENYPDGLYFIVDEKNNQVIKFIKHE